MLLQSVKKWAAKSIRPRAAKYDETAEFPWDNVREINELGLNSMFVPEAYGGSGMSYTAYLACCREIAMACAATGIVWATNFHAVSPLVDFARRPLAPLPYSLRRYSASPSQPPTPLPAPLWASAL